MSSFNHEQFRHDFVIHLQNRLGWAEETAKTAAKIASEVICETHGGKSHYVQARKLDYKEIGKAAANGSTVAELARTYGISAQTIRNHLKKTEKHKF